MVGPMEFTVLLLMFLGPGGLLLALAFSPMAPMIRYWMFGSLAMGVAAAIAAQLALPRA